MTWVKLDDSLPNHPKVRRLPPARRWLYVEGLCYSAQYLTDGEIASDFLQAKDAAALVKVGLLHEGHGCGTDLCALGTGEGFVIHDYLEYNPSKNAVMAKRAADAERKKRGRGSESRRNPDGLRSDSVRPVPSRPQPVEEQDQEQPATPSEIDPAEALLASDSGAQYLLGKLQDRDERWRVVKPGWLMKLAADFDPHTITDALRFAYDQPDTAVEPYPYLLTICRRIEEGAA